MRAFHLLASVLLAALTSAGPSIAAEQELPEAVNAVIAGYADTCKDLGGTLREGFDRPLVMATDLDGDGLFDYVLNPETLKCSAAATTYCGNGGCHISILVSADNYAKPVEAMGGVPSLIQADGATTLRLLVNRDSCPGAKIGDACAARYKWQGGEMTVTYALLLGPRA